MSHPGKHLRVEVRTQIVDGAPRYHGRIYHMRAGEPPAIVGVLHADAEQWDALTALFDLQGIEVKSVTQ